MAKGKFLVIDGTDGSGKATQTKLLIERLRAAGQPAESIAFPRHGLPSAAPVDEYLAGKYGTADQCGPKCASIFYAVDRFAASGQIRAWLEAGRHVVADRYVSANMGHQGGKLADPAARRELFRWLDELEHGTFGIPRPDLTIILHVSAEIGQRLSDQRDQGKHDIHQKDLNHLKRAEAAYLEMTRMFPENFRLIECVRDGQLLSREAIHELVWQAASGLLRR